jgi:hypothetical protein
MAYSKSPSTHRAPRTFGEVGRIKAHYRPTSGALLEEAFNALDEADEAEQDAEDKHYSWNDYYMWNDDYYYNYVTDEIVAIPA